MGRRLIQIIAIQALRLSERSSERTATMKHRHVTSAHCRHEEKLSLSSLLRMIRLFKHWLGIHQRQTCPICGSEVVVVLRYPNYVCRGCCRRTEDSDGRSVDFFNADLSGGFVARYRDTGEPYDSHECYIDGQRCRADEAHFGGIVIRPAGG